MISPYKVDASLVQKQKRKQSTNIFKAGKHLRPTLDKWELNSITYLSLLKRQHHWKQESLQAAKCYISPRDSPTCLCIAVVVENESKMSLILCALRLPNCVGMPATNCSLQVKWLDFPHLSKLLLILFCVECVHLHILKISVKTRERHFFLLKQFIPTHAHSFVLF